MPYWISVMVSLIAFAVSAITGIALVPYLKRLHFGQTILEIGPKWHKSKQGTPIMGGFMFILGSIVALVIGYTVYRNFFIDLTDDEYRTSALKLLCGVIYAILFSAIGFADDYIKAIKKRNLGLKAKQKLVFQILFSCAYLGALYALGDTKTTIDLFFAEIDLKLAYYPLIVLFMIFITNAVNLTDGIDGLCGSVTVVSMLGLAMLSSIMKSNEQNIFAMAVAGGCLGFLLWNLHPAKCFMGDTGSMYLGGAFAAISIALRCHLLIVIVGIIYIAEALSVVLQVISFKTTGKRIFKMSPIHHHFEMCKWSEYKIVIVFSFIGLIAAVSAVLLMIDS